jgi:alanine dehydrogenase
MQLLALDRHQVRELLDPAQLLDALADGFRALSAGSLDVPPRTRAATADGSLLCMPAAWPGRGLGTKLVSVFHDNGKSGLPTHQALILLFDPSSGAPRALLDGDCITALRTAAGIVLSIRLLARAGARSLAIVGAGEQAHALLHMLLLLPQFDDIRLASRNHQALAALHAEAPDALVCASVRQAVTDADVVCLCTSSAEPVLSASWLAPGTHLASVGFRPPGGEIGPDVLAVCELFVESRQAFAAPPAGCAELQGHDPDAATELGEVLLGRRGGRSHADALTVYKSMGHAMEDLVAAQLVYAAALSRGVGGLIEL